MQERTQGAVEGPFAGSEWFDPLEDAVRQGLRGFIEALVESELRAALWNETIAAYRRLTKRAEMHIAGAYLAGTNTRRVRRALQGQRSRPTGRLS